MNSKPYKLGRFSSEILIGEEFDLPPATGPSRSVYVFDANTWNLFGRSISPSVVLPAGESNKDWRGVDTILAEAVVRGLARDGVFVGVGGGIVCDLAAFAASVYMRGARLILVPTTLLAMVDAAFGGKTGFNFGGYKNMVGTFFPAERIVVCTAALASLPERELMGGLAEVIKTAMLGDAELFEILERERMRILARDPSLMIDVITRCLELKARIVRDDLTESGKRAHLNLGHTFAHALEAMERMGGRTHGEAVAWGLAKAMDLGVRMGITDEDYARSVRRLLDSYGFETTVKSIDPEYIVGAMKMDKKRRGGILRLVLQKSLGETVMLEADENDLREVIA